MKCILSAIMVLILLTTISCINDHSTNSSDVKPNQNIIQCKGFHVSSESTDLETSVRGTIFLSGSHREPDHAYIVAWVEIDPNDWGGVVFYIPDGWQVSNKTSSYPEGDNNNNPANYITQWNTASKEYDHDCMIEIGTNRSGTIGGGIGSVVIEIDATKQIKSSYKVFSIIVGVGCDEKDGVKIMHPDSELIEVPIDQGEKLP